MKLTRLIWTAEPLANWLALLSIAALTIKLALLNRIPAAFAGAQEAGAYVESVLTSVVASYVFYLLVVHLRQVTDRATVRPYVMKHAHRVVNDCRHQLSSIAGASKTELFFESATLAQLMTALRCIAPQSEAPMQYHGGNGRADWLQYFAYYADKSRQSIARIFQQLPYLDATLVSLVVAVDDSDHFEHTTFFDDATSLGNTDLAAWAESFFRYCEACRSLENYVHATERTAP